MGVPDRSRAKLAVFAVLGIFGVLFLSGCQRGSPPQATTPPRIITLTPLVTATAAPTATRNPATNHALGPDDAFLTIIMYGDFACSICLDVARTLAILRDSYQADIRLVFRHFPQTTDNSKALLAAQAAEAAGEQGKFWEMHDQLYVNQPIWRNLTLDQFRAKLSDYSKTVGLDLTRFSTALDRETMLPLIQQSIKDAQDLGLKGVPVLVFNGQAYAGRIDLWSLENFARLKLIEKRWLKAQPSLQIDVKKKYQATLKTAQGDVVIDLFADAAPVAVNNFVALARAGWYDDNTFHLMIPGQLVQTGDPSGSGYGGPGYTILDERQNGLLFDREGVVAMAGTRGQPNSAGSQFFIALAPLRPSADYDGQFTIFGIVMQGMDVLRKLTPRNQFDEVRYPNPPPGDVLISITIQEK